LLSAFSILAIIGLSAISSDIKRRELSNVLGFFFLLLTSILWGTRANHIGADTFGYYYNYLEYASYSSVRELLQNEQTDYLFMFVQYFFAKNFLFPVFLLFISFLINTCIFVFVKLFIEREESISDDAFLIFLFAALLSFPSLHSNIIRNGLAVSMLLLALGFWLNRKFVIATVFCVLAVLFHQTAIIPIGIIIFFSGRLLGCSLYLLRCQHYTLSPDQ
jgi:hypothetical protein